MKIIYPIIGTAGLLLLLIPSVMHYTGSMEFSQMKSLMLAGTLIWFAVAIPWLGKKSREEPEN